MGNATGTRERIFRTRQAHVESVQVEFVDWKNAYAESATPYDAQDWANECILAGTSTIEEARNAFAALRKNALVWDVLAYGSALGNLLDKSAELFAFVGDFLDVFKARGNDLDKEEEFRNVNARLLATQRRFVEVWPKIDEEMWQESLEQIQRGEVEFTEDILHEFHAENSGGD